MGSAFDDEEDVPLTMQEPEPSNDLALRAATPRGSIAESAALCGFEPLPRRGTVVSNELINRLRGADGGV